MRSCSRSDRLERESAVCAMPHPPCFASPYLTGAHGSSLRREGGEGQREVVLSAHISCSTFYPLLSSVAEEFWPGFTACHLFLAPLLLPPSHHHLSPPFLRDFYPPDGKGFLRSRSLGIKTFSPPSLFFWLVLLV